MNLFRTAAGGGLALVLLLGSGCSSNSGQSAAPAPATQAAPASPTTHTPTTQSPTTHSPTTSSPDPRPRPVPPRSSDLADGRYPARITRVDPAARRVTVDVVQFFFGEDAIRAARQDGSRDIPPPNDYWIRNSSPTLRTLRVGSGAPITVNVLGAAESGSSTTNVAKTLAGLAALGPPDYALFWLTVSDGTVTRIAEQYLP